MARKQSPTPTDAELRLMDILWEKGEATVAEVVEALPGRRPLAYSTVLTTLRILERKGYVRHAHRGRAFVYRPAIGRREARRGAIRYVLSRFFQNDPGLLLVNILEHERLESQELERLKEMLGKGE